MHYAYYDRVAVLGTGVNNSYCLVYKFYRQGVIASTDKKGPIAQIPREAPREIPSFSEGLSDSGTVYGQKFLTGVSRIWII